MSKPFQFSMQRMFLATIFFCLAAWCFSALVRFATQGDAGPAQLSLLGLFVFVGAAVGTISGRPLAGIGWALLLLFVLYIATSLLFAPRVQT